MIITLGTPAWSTMEPATPAGRSARIAVAAVARGGRVELVGRIGDDGPGDALLIALARAGVGHAAILRDPVLPTARLVPVTEDDAAEIGFDDEAEPVATVTPGPVLDRADIALGLSYLTSYEVLVVTDEVSPAARPAAMEAAAYAGAHLVLILPDGERVPDGLLATATVLAAPRDPDDAEFASLVGAYAAALERGAAPAEAFAAARGTGWEAVASSA